MRERRPLNRRDWWPHLDAPDLIDHTIDGDHDPGVRDVGVGGGPGTPANPCGVHPSGVHPPGGRVALGDLVARTAASRVAAANSHTPTPTPTEET